MRDIPIIFSAPMVLALLDGRKTMTRRLLYSLRTVREDHPHCGGVMLRDHPRPGCGPGHFYSLTGWERVQPGDRLWVKETFVHYREKCKDSSTGFVDWLHFRATDEDAFKPGIKWKPSIFMPRVHSRLTLTVTATKIEPLQMISEQDAISEGIVAFNSGSTRMYGVPVAGGYAETGISAWESFMNLWSTIHGPSAWRDNPEVVALTFTVQKKNIDDLPKAEAA